jgi:nitrogen regulatory protein PII
MTLKTLTHINNRPVIVEAGMKSVEVCLEDLQDSPFFYTQTMLEFCDEVEAEQRLASICKAAITGNSADVRIFAVGLANMVNDAARKRAEKLASKPDPTFESNHADVKREM